MEQIKLALFYLYMCEMVAVIINSVLFLKYLFYLTFVPIMIQYFPEEK
jgi:hypothetical protein